jgi:hypothetical protein
MKSKDLRQDGDYKDFIKISMEEAQGQYNDAVQFIEQIEDTLTHLGYRILP